MDEVKEAFVRVKEDIDFLYKELNYIKYELKKVNPLMIKLIDENKSFKKDISLNLERFETIINNSRLINKQQTDNKQTTNRQTEFPTYNPTQNIQYYTYPTYNPTHPTHIKALEPQNIGISTRNGGVPTDKQTDRQTDQHIQISSHNQEKLPKDSIKDAIQIIDSLDSLKKEIRLKFKRLTDQEMSVFITLYQLSEEFSYTDYKSLSIKLNLTESSIRDYIGRLIKKGIPVDKTKVNNKSIQLSISTNLKKIASLQTILQLRDI
jgi:hypothetical protein